MTDPSTLLLLTCATCASSPIQSARADDSGCFQTSESDQNHASGAQSSCISPPEAIPVALKPKRTATRTLAQAPRPTPPESLANLSVPDNRVHPLLQFGSQGKAVIDLQMKLQQLGYYKGAIDGIYGRQTEAAILQLQKGKGLKVDGIAGSQTWSTLQTLPTTKRETQEKATDADDGNEAFEGKPFLSPSPQGEATDSAGANVRTSVTFTGISSKYLFLGWGIMFASGFIFILNDGIGQIRRYGSFKGDRQSVPPNETTDATDSIDNITSSLPIDSQESEEEISDRNTLDPENFESDPRAFLKQIRELIESAVEIDATENSPPFSYFIPFHSAKGSHQKNSLPPFLHQLDSDCRVRALLSDEKGNLYLSNPDGGTDAEIISLDLTNQEVIPLWANNGLVQPLKNLVIDLRAPLRLPIFSPQAIGSPQTPLLARQPSSGSEVAAVEKQTPPSTADTFVTTLPLGNPRIGEAYSYTLVNDASGRFLLRGNELRMVDCTHLEDEPNTSHTIVLRRTDAEGRSEEKSFKINRNALQLAAFRLGQAFTPAQTVSSSA